MQRIAVTGVPGANDYSLSGDAADRYPSEIRVLTDMYNLLTSAEVNRP